MRRFVNEALDYPKIDIETIPIFQIAATRQRPFIRLVGGILAAKKRAFQQAQRPDTCVEPVETSEQEAEIDQRVYTLYGLTTEQAAAVEERE